MKGITSPRKLKHLRMLCIKRSVTKIAETRSIWIRGKETLESFKNKVLV